MTPEFEAGIFDSRGRRGPGKQATDGMEVDGILGILEQAGITPTIPNERVGIDSVSRKDWGKL